MFLELGPKNTLVIRDGNFGGERIDGGNTDRPAEQTAGERHQ
jgi:hypothetical protein